jgi:hypothetical protein
MYLANLRPNFLSFCDAIFNFCSFFLIFQSRYPTLNWTCSQIGNYSQGACDAVQRYEPDLDYLDYFASVNSKPKSNDYAQNIPLTQIDENVKYFDAKESIKYETEAEIPPEIYIPSKTDKIPLALLNMENKIGIGNIYKNSSLNHLIKTNSNQDVLPSFIIMGVMKCGTGAINKFLRFHPDLRTCGETYFFSDVNYHKGLDWYKSIMPKINQVDKQVYEKTPTYYRTPKIAQRIHAMNSTIKLIYVGKCWFKNLTFELYYKKKTYLICNL